MSYYSSPQEPHQFELFSSQEEQSSGGKKGLFSKKISLALEHLIIAAIAVLVLCVVVFSMGIERGKQAASEKMGGMEINFADSQNDVIITPSSEPVNQPNASVPARVEPPAVRAVVQAPAANQEIVVDVPVPAEEPPQDVAAPSGVYTVQVASFKQRKFADQEVSALKKKGYDAFTVSKGSYYLVCVGRSKAKTQADKTSKSLKSKYKDNIVRRL